MTLTMYMHSINWKDMLLPYRHKQLQTTTKLDTQQTK